MEPYNRLWNPSSINQNDIMKTNEYNQIFDKLFISTGVLVAWLDSCRDLITENVKKREDAVKRLDRQLLPDHFNGAGLYYQRIPCFQLPVSFRIEVGPGVTGPVLFAMGSPFQVYMQDGKTEFVIDGKKG